MNQETENTGKRLNCTYLTPLGAWALAFGCAVGWGAFVMPGNTFLPIAGPIGTALGIALGSAVMLLLAANYHFLMNRFPGCGGAYTYTKRCFGYDHGFVAAWFLILIYVAIIWRGTTIAMASRHSYQGLAAMGATMMIGLQTFVIIGGVIKLIPLTGVTMPFVSSGGSSLVSSMCLTGLIQGVASLNEDDLEEDLKLTEM